MGIKVTINETSPVETEDEKTLISLQVPVALRHRVRRDAFERDMSVSAVVREILESYYSALDEAGQQ